VPQQAQRNDAKAQRHDALNDPNRNPVGQNFAAPFFRLHQLQRRQAEKNGDARGKGAAEDARERLPAAGEKIGQRREAEQAAVARGEHAAQQADDQNQMLLQGRSAAEAAVEEFAPDDFDERQQHQRGQRQRDQKVLRLPEPA
jgi:hypothetical protein